MRSLPRLGGISTWTRISDGLSFPMPCFLTALCFLSFLTKGLCDGAGGKQNLLDIVLQGYDIDKWPTFQEGDLENELTEPTRANLSLDIMFISSIDVQAMDLTIDFYLNQRWRDPRLQYPQNLSKRKIVLRTVEQIKRIWTPDTYMVNAKSANFHEVTTPNRLVYIDHDGNVMYSARITAKLACEMHFGMYPVDTQVCHLHLASYAYTTSHLKFHWTEEAITYGSTEDLNQFTLADKWTEESEDKYPDGYYPCLRVHFKFKRNFGHHLIQTYLPTVLIVTISWVSFFLEAAAIPARVSLGITTFLTMITLNSGAKVGLPPVSYVKAIDIWMLACTFFVFSTLWHYVLVCVVSRRPISGAGGSARNSSQTSKNRGSRPSTFSQRPPSEMMASQHHSPNCVKHRLVNGGSPEVQIHELTGLHHTIGHVSSPEFSRHQAPQHIKDRSDSAVSEPIWILRSDASCKTHFVAPTSPGVMYNPIDIDSPINDDGKKASSPLAPNGGGLAAVQPRKKKLCRCQCMATAETAKDRAKRIDIYARWLYPLAFLLFNVVYWGYYLNLNPESMRGRPAT